DPLHLNTLATAYEKLSEYKTILDRLGRSRKFLETLLGLGTAVSELGHTVKAVLGCVNVIYKRLEEEDVRSKSLLDLIESMACALGYVEDVEQFARLKELKRAIEDIRPLVEDTTNFLLKYLSDNTLGICFLSPWHQDQIKGLISRFEQFKSRFDRGISVQSAVTTEALLTLLISNQEDAIIAKLKPANLEYGLQAAECMEGTRQDILAEINSWLDDIDAPNILWLKGYPGVGKSAISSSLVEQLRSSVRLGSSFFFQREKPNVMTPHALWRTVAYDLGRQYPNVRKCLISTLKEDESIPNTVNVDKLFRQLIHDPLVASEDIPVGRLPVVVIDALDECGGLDGQYSEHRVGVLRTLKIWSQLPKKFKLFVTGRNESDIGQFFSTTEHHLIEVFAGTSVKPQSFEDIKKYLTDRFQQIAARYPNSLSSDWPGSQVATKLTGMAGGVFIWARTVADFTARGDPKEQLNRIMEGDGAGDLARLYSLILNTSFPSPTKSVEECFRSVLGTVILAKTPLPTSTLANLLSLEDTKLEFIYNGLQSVMDTLGTPRIYHQSFVDFLIDQSKCPSQFFIDIKQESRALTIACFRIMESRLKFNICGFESSHLRNRDIPNLAARVDECIPPYFSYACCFWASHLEDTLFESEVMDHVQIFMSKQFLHWLEVLSLTSRVNTASQMMWILVDWIRVSFPKTYYVKLTHMQKFVATFGGIISQSLPHIYLSALPFSPKSSAVSRQYAKSYPQTLSVQMGGHLKWPQTQNVLSGHGMRVYSVVFSPDGRRIVSGSSDKTIRVWDAQTGELIVEPLQGHKNSVWSVAFSPDGRRIVSGSKDTTIRVWDSKTGLLVTGPFQGHQDSVTSVAFSPNGRQIVSGSYDTTIRIWDGETGRLFAGPLNGHWNRVTSVAFSPNGRRIISGSYDTTIRVWDGETGEPFAGPLYGHNNVVWSVKFSPDGRRFVSSSSDNTIRVWDGETYQLVSGPLEGHGGVIWSVAFSPNGRQFVSGASDWSIRVWDGKTCQLVSDPLEGHRGTVLSVAFSPDGRRIVSSSDDRTIRVWDAQTGELDVGSLQGHDRSVLSVAFSPNGKRIASGSNDKTVRVWDAQTGELVIGPLQGHENAVWSVAFSPDGRRIVSGSSDRTIRVWDGETGELFARPLHGHQDGVTSVAFSLDGRWFVSGASDRSIRVWDGENFQLVLGPLEGHCGTVWSVAFSPDGRWIVSGSDDWTIRVWDAQTGQLFARSLQGHDSAVYSVAFSPNGKRIISGSRDKTIRVWDAQTVKHVIGPLQGHESAVWSVAFSSDGRRIVSGSKDTTIRIWDSETGELLAGPLHGHKYGVASVVFSPDGMLLVSGSYDRTIRTWNVSTDKFIQRLSGGIVSPSFCDSSHIEDGWVIGPNAEPLFWVPPGLHTGLYWPRNILCIGKGDAAKLDLRFFVHGQSWVFCNKTRDL
ncbi:hypothetical protein M408DRAFT_72023, partial [Serendipita vermifera MAFF 305830]